MEFYENDKENKRLEKENKRLEKENKRLEKENKRLEKVELQLEALEAAGVDNWSGYSYAMELLESEE